MSIGIVILIFAVTCLAASAGLWAFLRIHPRLGWLDVPNERSSHTTPVPRGAGVVIVSVVLLSYILASYSFGRTPDQVFLVTSLLIAAVSLADDIRSMPLLPRLLTHFAAASVLVWFNGGYLGSEAEGLGIDIPFGPILTVLFIVWMINAYNFMDGIDGILGIQGLAAGAAWAVAGIVFGTFTLVLLGTAIAGACLGFLFFNWQPARVFMGDVGSTFLGFALASAPLIGNDIRGLDTQSGLVLSLCFSALFVFDTLYTRAVLVVKRSRFWLPHREHLYQKLARAGVSHGTVSAYFGAAGTIVSGICILAVLNKGIFNVVALFALATIFLILYFWAGKKHIDLNIG